MAGLLDGVMDQLGPNGVAQIASGLGIDESAATKAIGLALPAIMGGMATNAAKPNGAQALSTALDEHSPSIFEQLGPLLAGDGPGGAILGHVLGQKQGNVQQNLAGQSGLDLGTIAKLLPILAPIVMGFLSKQKQDNGLDAGGVGKILQQERATAETSNPGLGGLGAILDADGDGSIVDDVMGMAGGGSGGSSKSGLGGLLGKLLGGRK